MRCPEFRAGSPDRRFAQSETVLEVGLLAACVGGGLAWFLRGEGEKLRREGISPRLTFENWSVVVAEGVRHFSTVDVVKDQKRIQDVRAIQMCPPVLRKQFGILSWNQAPYRTIIYGVNNLIWKLLLYCRNVRRKYCSFHPRPCISQSDGYSKRSKTS